MRLTNRRLFPLAFAVWLAWPLLGMGQEQSSSQGTSDAAPRKDGKKRDRQLNKELGSAYDSWLRDDVPEIVTPDERKAFLQLSTNEEREQFIEIFWRDRNPEPDSPINTVKEEHYRRLAYADEHFASGVSGRRTDRGRIYIIWGPPDEIQSHPTGGSYERPMSEGGGSTTTHPFEVWRYRHLEGIGENIEIEFVDPSGSGEYHLAYDPCEKDALARVPGAGLSLGEMMGQSTKASRFTNSSGTTCPVPLGGMANNTNQFDNLSRYFLVQRAPEHFKDLAEKVSSRLVANQLSFLYRADFLRATSNTVVVPITVQLRNRDLAYRNKGGVQSAVLDVYARISDPGGRVIQTFEDLIRHDIPETLFKDSLNLNSIYQKSVPLRSGLYRLDVVIKDTESGNIGILGTALRVPRFEEEKMDASSLILADQIEHLAPSRIGTGQFVLDAFRVRPRLTQELSSGEKLGIYLQLYNLKVDEISRKTKVSVVYRILKDQQEMWRQVETPDNIQQGGEQLSIERYVPVSTLQPGRYVIEVSAIDLLTNETVIRSSEFTIKPGAGKADVAVPKS